MSTSAASQNKTLNDLRDTLEGQKITIPSIYQTFPNWKVRLHQDYQKARDEALNPWLRKWVLDDATARKLLSADLGVFAAILASGAPFDILCTTAKFFAWYFVYDDIYDCGALQNDETGAIEYRLASLQYFKFTLLGEGDAPDLSVFDTELRNGLQCWDEVGKHICQICSFSTRQVLCDELLRYVGSLNSMDSVFTEHGFPSVERYWERREATAGAYCVIATIPFVYGVDTDRAEVQDPLIKDLWKHTSQFVHITNDILSMRKEMRDGQIENLIPIVMLNEKVDCATAMNQSYQFLYNEATGFYQTRVRILERAQQNSETVPKMFIEGCLNVAMGLAHWSYSGDRYIRSSDRKANNVTSFTVELPKANSSSTVQAKSSDLKGYISSLWLLSQHTTLHVIPFTPLIMVAAMTIVPRFGSFNLFSPFVRNMAG